MPMPMSTSICTPCPRPCPRDLPCTLPSPRYPLVVVHLIYLAPSPHLDTPWLLPPRAPPQYTTASELYSFAIIVWELLTADKPWKVDAKGRAYNDAAIVMAVISGERPPLPPERPAEPAEAAGAAVERRKAHAALRRIARASWASEPTQRPTFANVRHELGETLRRIDHARLAIVEEEGHDTGGVSTSSES